LRKCGLKGAEQLFGILENEVQRPKLCDGLDAARAPSVCCTSWETRFESAADANMELNIHEEEKVNIQGHRET
jgi:hypothetical protein